MSSLEHVSVIGLSQVLREERGVAVKTIRADLGDAVFLEYLGLALTDRTRLVCVSQVASADGRRLPAAEAATIAHARGVPVLVDAAQSVGQVPVDVAALGCDYLVGSGHKWLLGPMGTGFLFVAADHLASFRPDFVPDYSPWLKHEETLPTITAQSRSEVGTYSHAMVVGLGRTIEIMVDVGIDAIQSRAAELSAILRNEVSQWDRVKVLTPMEPARSAGITTLMFDGFDDADMKRLVDRLYEDHSAVVKAQWLTAPPDPEQVAMRISIAAFNNEEEVQRLIDGLREGI